MWSGCARFLPLLITVLFTVTFTRTGIAAFDTGGVPYPVFAFTGLLAWNLTASALRFAVSSLTANINLVAKVYFPREIFPFSAVFVSAVDYAGGAILLVGLLIWYPVPVTATVLCLPIVPLVQLVFTASGALFLAMANLFYRDVKYLFEVFITLWMFASSAVYPLDNVPGTAGRLLALNPMTAILDAHRDVILYGRLP